MPRPTKLTPERAEALIELLRDGVYVETACAACGVGTSTFYRWMTIDREPYVEFRDAVKKAEAEAETRAVEVVRNAATTSWQAAAWWLERKFPERWGRRDCLALTRDVARLSDAEIDARIEELENGA